MSKLDQLHSRPSTHVLTTRVDGRYLATLLRYWRAQGEAPRSISELIRLSVETFTEFLVLNQKIDFVQTQEAAQEILNNTGFAIKRVNPKNIAQALAAEGATYTPSSPSIDPTHREQVKATPVAAGNPLLDEARTRIEKALEGDLEKRVEDAQSRTQAFKDALENPPEESS